MKWATTDRIKPVLHTHGVPVSEPRKGITGGVDGASTGHGLHSCGEPVRPESQNLVKSSERHRQALGVAAMQAPAEETAQHLRISPTGADTRQPVYR